MPESRSMIDFDHVGIGDAIMRNRFAVPRNQREYRWEEKQVLDLFQDLGNAINTSKGSYFLGTIVLTPGQDDVLELVDGQQRLATTTILLAAIRDYFQDERHDELLVTSLEQFLFTIVRETRETLPRLRLNVADNEFFRVRILERSSSAARKQARATKESHRRIEHAAQLAAQHVQDVIKPLNDKHRVNLLNVWVRFIEQRVQVILAKCPDDVNAYIMFETLNDRGLKTSQTDLLKNYLFAQADDRIVEAQERWSSMSGTLEAIGDDDDEMTITYLRHFAIAAYGQYCASAMCTREFARKSPARFRPFRSWTHSRQRQRITSRC